MPALHRLRRPTRTVCFVSIVVACLLVASGCRKAGYSSHAPNVICIATPTDNVGGIVGASEWVTAAAGGVSPVLAVITPGLYGLGLANCTTTATNTGTIVVYYGTLQVTSGWRDRA